MNRLPDWPDRLQAFVSKEAVFAWGTNDCCLWACDGVREMTGVDPGAWFRGRYSDQAGARKALYEFAGGGLAATARKLARDYARTELQVLQARRGDLVVCEGDDMAALGLCVGRFIVLLTPSGKRHVRLSDALIAFRV